MTDITNCSLTDYAFHQITSPNICGLIDPESLKTGMAVVQNAFNTFQYSQAQKASDHLYRALLKGHAKVCPKSELRPWTSPIQAQCFSLKTLEQRLGKEIASLRSLLDDHTLNRYGNKHKNLILQAGLAEALKIPRLSVPMPHGIPSDQVLHFIQSYAPEVLTAWTALGNLYRAHPGIDFLQRPEVQFQLTVIDQALATLFETAAHDEALYHALVPKEVREWLKRVISYLMIRSTGAEDSKYLANAGGNVSRAYVLPTRKAFVNAMGDVVRSYFGTASLQNRMNAGINPFSQSPLLAVTAQELIGEIPGQTSIPDIPLSLVLFSSEPLYAGDESFRVMRISATYGHGEGVVGNQGIGTDTVLILNSEKQPDELYILYDNASKPTRLAPLETEKGIDLEKVDNPPSLQQRPVLSNELLARLYQWGVASEQFFGDHPTDNEIVIQNGEIRPVQARPIIRPTMLPTYFDSKTAQALETSPISKLIQGEILVPGKASAMIISNPDEVLEATTLEIAQKLFIKEKHRIVIVREPEPANSHPVVNFSSLGIPCLHVSKQPYESIKPLITSKTPLVACVQTASLRIWDQSMANPQDYVKQGFAVHPAKIAMTFNTPVKRLRDSTEKILPEIKNLFVEIREAPSPQAAIALTKQLRSHPWVKSIKSYRENLEQQLNSLTYMPKQIKETTAFLKELDQHIDRSFDELQHTLATMQPHDRLLPFLHAKVLEHLLLSQHPHQTSYYSALDIKPLYMTAVEQIDYQKQLASKTHLSSLLPVGHLALDNSFATKWRTFLLSLEPLIDRHIISNEDVMRFKHLIRIQRKMDLLTTSNSFFFPDLSTMSPQQAFKAYLQLFPKEEDSVIENMLNISQQVNSQASQIERFGKKQSFEAAFIDLSQQMQSFHSQSLKHSFSSSPVARLLVLKNMHTFVDHIDKVIKTMKASQEFSQDEKVVLFTHLLTPYLRLLEDWTFHLSNYQAIPRIPGWTAHSYFKTLNRVFNELTAQGVQTLEATREFSVSAAILGAETDFGRHLPQSLEDLFTLIHQNHLALIARESRTIFSEQRIQEAHIPSILKESMKIIQTTDIGKPLYRVSIDTSDYEVVTTYNIPLENHSSQLVLEYNKNTEQVTLTAKMLGEARGRWRTVVLLADILNLWSLLPLSLPSKLHDQEAIVSWKIDSTEDLKKALAEFKHYYQISLEMISPDQAVQTMLERWKDLPKNQIAQRMQKLLESSWDEVRLSTLYITKKWDEETRHAHGFPIFLKLLHDESAVIQFKAGSLAAQMIQSGSHLSEFSLLIPELIRSPQSMQREVSYDIAHRLAQHADMLPIVKRAIQSGLIDPSGVGAFQAATLGMKLVDEGKIGSTESIALIKQLCRHVKGQLQEICVRKVAAWIDQDKELPFTLEVTRKHISHDDLEIRDVATRMAVKLALKKYESEIKALVIELVNHENVWQQLSGLNLASNLLKKGLGLEEALEAVQKLSLSDVSYVREKANALKALAESIEVH